jgi:hypothetical protein
VAVEGTSFLRGGGLEVAPARVGDVNGDGREDLAVVSRGLIQVLFGGERFGEDEYVEERIARGMGAAVLHSGARAASVSGGADFDGDGIGDLAVGLLQDSGDTGLVRFLPGRAAWPASLFLEDVPAWSSDGANDRFGHQVSLLGDVNGDGRGEALAGAPGNGSADGHGYVIFGAPDPRDETTGSLLARGAAARVDAFKRRDSLGTEVCSPGDFDGDGIDDIAISAEGGGIDFAGESYVVLGGPAFEGRPPGTPLALGDLGDRSVRILGEQAGDGAYRIAPAGDFDGDGRRDILVGANAPEGEPRAHVVFGRPAGTVSLGALSGGGVRIVGPFRPALHVAGAGDVNGDGFSDAAVGGYALPGGETTVFLVFGQGAEAAFIRGDTNGDRKLDISDPVALLGHLFLGGELRCVDAGDGNDDGALDITDAIFVLNHLFLGAPGPPPPFPERGRDPTEDPLGCELAI